MPKVFIGTPAYQNTVHAEYCISLSRTINLLEKNNIETIVMIKMSGSLLSLERNKIVEEFMKSDCTHLLCIDNDVAWQPEAVFKLLEYNEDFVGGVYTTKLSKEFIVRLKINENGGLYYKGNLIEVNAMPAGFMLISRNVIQKMFEHFPELKFFGEEAERPVRYALFNTILRDEQFWGEDFTFCMRAQEAGFRLFIDPSLKFNHAGIVGSVQEALQESEYIHKTPTFLSM